MLEKLRRREPFNAKDKLLHEQGLVSVLHSLHEELDAAVLQAYGWQDLGPVPWFDEPAHAAWTETLLQRLVALNARRAAEEAAGTVRWLRPDFQDPARRAALAQAAAAEATPAPPPAHEQTSFEGMAAPLPSSPDAADANEDADSTAPPSAASTTTPATQAWPSTLPEQVRAVAQLLSASPSPLPLPRIEAAFKGKGPWKKGLPRILDTLQALGRAQQAGDGWRG